MLTALTMVPAGSSAPDRGTLRPVLDPTFKAGANSPWGLLFTGWLLVAPEWPGFTTRMPSGRINGRDKTQERP
jgi:hypothetical protein